MRHKILSAVLAVLALLVVITMIGFIFGDDETDNNNAKSPDESTTSASPTAPPPSATPTPTPTPVKPSKSSAPSTPPAPTDAQVTQAFESFINERAESGVALAKSAASVTVSDGVVTVVVDPESAGLSTSAVLETSPYENLAEFFGVPVVFSDDDGVWLRRSVQRVDVVDAAGESLGSMTAAELKKIGTG